MLCVQEISSALFRYLGIESLVRFQHWTCSYGVPLVPPSGGSNVILGGALRAFNYIYDPSQYNSDQARLSLKATNLVLKSH